MKKIQLHGKYSYLFIFIDDEDFEEVSQYKWYGCKGKNDNTIYARADCYYNNKRVQIKMHRLILGLEFGNKLQGDHKDHNGLNNQKYNLRIVTCQQNQFNRQPYKNTSSEYKGVSWHKRDKVWQAYIKYSGKLIMLSCFNNEIEAAQAYNKKASELFGEYAKLNTI